MRPVIDMDQDLRTEVRQYAQTNGLTTSRAYAELIKTGLNATDDGEAEA